MNLLIENLNSSLLNSLSVDVIKTINGEFSKEDLERELINLYYNKAIIDITAIKNYADFSSLFNFLSFFDKSKVILLLNDSELVNSSNYLSKLVENGYYNFTRNGQGINYLISNPNELKDVEKYIIPNTFVNPLFNNSVDINQPVYNNQNMNSVSPSNAQSSGEAFVKGSNQMIIGIQNLTEHAGSTTLMYMMLKQLRVNYKVQGIAMMSQDYIYFRDPDIIPSTSLEDLKMKLKTYTSKEVILIDLNDVNGDQVCDTIIYLIEPGIVRLSKLLRSNKDLNSLMNKGKFVLNRSALKDDEVANFEYESKIKVFYNLVNFNERKDRLQVIDKLLVKLGFNKQQDNSGLFGMFK